MSQQIELKLGAQQEDVLQPKRFDQLGARPLPALIEGGAKARPHAVRARPAFLPSDIAAEDAFRLTLLQCKWHIAANIPAVMEAHDMEGLHQMRVGFRRLRVALTSFGSDFRTQPLEALRHRARKLAEKLAPARDLDVFVEELLEPAARANGAVEAFDLLRARANDARRVAWGFALAHVSSPAFSDFMTDLNHTLERPVAAQSQMRGAANRRSMAFDMPATALADKVLSHRMKYAQKRAKRLNELSDEQRHRLRISLKKLRYTAEFFAPLYERDDVAKFAERLSRMQDILGALNDVAVARETLKKLTDHSRGGQANADLSFAAGIVYGWHLDRATHTFRKGVKRWKQFARHTPFWQNETAH